jgi:protein-L-isoaspartate(D-aspartate) O-methyltransferase
MVQAQIRGRGIYDRRVLAAMEKVERHRFVPLHQRASAYGDFPLPIGDGQTISQPYMVACMSELLRLKGDERVLEIGTGSGYQAAVLAELAAAVYTIERIESLGQAAATLLAELGYDHIRARIGDGTRGWPEEAPFDAILVTAGAPEAPEPLRQQLAIGGRLVVPVGSRHSQVVELHLRLGPDEFEVERSTPCRFVDLIGQHGWES